MWTDGRTFDGEWKDGKPHGLVRGIPNHRFALHNINRLRRVHRLAPMTAAFTLGLNYFDAGPRRVVGCLGLVDL